MKIKILTLLLVLLGFCSFNVAAAMGKGIYLTSSTAEDTKTLDYLIKQAKSTGIDSFIVDVDAVTKLYSKNVPEISKNGIKYVARIVVFPHGANASQMKSQAILEKRWKQIEYALSLGASAIQLDYIRYSSRGHSASSQNQKDVYGAITYFRNKLKEKNPNVTLQADVFGTIAYKTETGIGQDVTDVAKGVDALNPMVYPSHFWPPAMHSVTPYLTVYDAIGRFKKKLDGNFPNVKVNAYLEVHNYRYRMPDEKNYKYIQAQITGARDAGADGWYFWSAHNQYDNLFHVLKNNQVDTMKHDFRAAESPKFNKRLFNAKAKTEKVADKVAADKVEKVVGAEAKTDKVTEKTDKVIGETDKVTGNQ
ncbi:hypothetical protein BH10PSE19_BH10PSE19_04030 [soil metagenome]